LIATRITYNFIVWVVIYIFYLNHHACGAFVKNLFVLVRSSYLYISDDLWVGFALSCQ
jgi:hypothetical protein